MAAKTVEEVAAELRAKHAPSTTAERRMAILAVIVFEETIAAGGSPEDGWDRVTNICDQALVGLTLAHEGKRD